jgi:hypothetical protein
MKTANKVQNKIKSFYISNVYTFIVVSLFYFGNTWSYYKYNMIKCWVHVVQTWELGKMPSCRDEKKRR